MSENNPRAFIDMNGGYQSHREGAEKLAHDAWVKSNTWNLTRDDFIRLSYFHGDLEDGSDGLGPVNGSEDRPDDAVYIGANGGVLSRSMVSYWLADCNSFMHGYKTAIENAATQPPQDERGQVYAKCYVCDKPMDGTSEDDCHCFHRKEFAAQPVALSTLTDEQILAGVKEFADENYYAEYKDDILRCVRALLAASAQAAASCALYALTDDDLMEADAVETLVEEGWVWDGDQWQRPPEQVNAAPAQQAGQGEPIGWLKPNESYAPDAFRWARTDTHIRPLFFANEPSITPQPEVAKQARIEALEEAYKLLDDESKAHRVFRNWQAKQAIDNAAYSIRALIDAVLSGTGSDESAKESGNGN